MIIIVCRYGGCVNCISLVDRAGREKVGLFLLGHTDRLSYIVFLCGLTIEIAQFRKQINFVHQKSLIPATNTCLLTTKNPL